PHYFLGWPADGAIKTRSKLDGLPIDTRGAAGLIVASPSAHLLGTYTWVVPPDAVTVAEAPAAWLAWIRTAKSVRKPKPTTASKGKVLVVQPAIHADVVQRAIAYLAQCPLAVSGSGGHAQTFAVARALV